MPTPTPCSTVERYRKEVLSGTLSWGPLHTERFWREHANELDKVPLGLYCLLLVGCCGVGIKLVCPGLTFYLALFLASLFIVQDEFRLVKRLRDYCMESESAETVAVAVYDLGEFSRFYPQGKQYVPFHVMFVLFVLPFVTVCLKPTAKLDILSCSTCAPFSPSPAPFIGSILKKLGCKECIMLLMDHEDQQVPSSFALTVLLACLCVGLVLNFPSCV